jgi:hypothetical protein
MNGIADSTPSESQNAYKTNGKTLILKQADPTQQSAMNGIADSTPSESQHAYKTNGKTLVLKQAHPSNHR